MGSAVCEAVRRAADLSLVAEVVASGGLAALRASAAQVAVDFTNPDAVMENVEWCIAHGVHAVVGTTGFTDTRLQQLRSWLADAPSVGVAVVPNFGIGALLLRQFAERAARYFESAEIVELHHPRKLDAASGTARHVAERIAIGRNDAGLGEMPDSTATAIDGARGADIDGVPVHSLRLSGSVAHHRLLFGGQGEVLEVRHDSLDRMSFVPGVLLVVRAIAARPGLTLGLESFLDMASDSKG